MARLLGVCGTSLLGLLAISAGMRAQEVPPPPSRDSLRAESGLEGRTESAEPTRDSTDLVFEREVFIYPEYQRRNPFQSLLASDAQGPLFEDLILLGVLFSNDPQRSVALLGEGAGGGAGGESQALRTFRVRRGDSLGNLRIVEIEPTRVLVDVQEFGLSEQRVLELKRPSEGSSR